MSLIEERETGFRRQVSNQSGTYNSVAQAEIGTSFASGSFFVATKIKPAPHDAFMSYVSIGDLVREMAIKQAALISPRLHERINALAGLRANWDGNRGKAVKSHVLAEVVETLRRLKWQFGKSFIEPSLVPTFDGYLQMEWHERKRSLDIEAVNEGWSVVGTSKALSGDNDYFEGEFERSSFEQTVKMYLWVIGSELLWPLT